MEQGNPAYAYRSWCEETEKACKKLVSKPRKRLPFELSLLFMQPLCCQRSTRTGWRSPSLDKLHDRQAFLSCYPTAYPVSAKELDCNVVTSTLPREFDPFQKLSRWTRKSTNN